MNGQTQILHDVMNILVELQRHAETMMESIPAQEAQSLYFGLTRMGNLLQEYREVVEGSALEELEVMQFCDWSDHLHDQALPILSVLHGVDITYKADLKTSASGIIRLNHAHRICENLVANAVAAGASRIDVELLEFDVGFDLVFRDNGCGMSETQIQQLGLGMSTRSGAGHGQGFRIILQLAAEIGAIVRTPKSIPGLGTEFRVSFMKVGAAQLYYGIGERAV